jgi:hypothetical protein
MTGPSPIEPPATKVVDDELAFHLEMQIRRYVDGGAHPEQH